MAVDGDSYGTVAGVEALVGDIPINTSTARTFSTTTTPTTAQVEGFIDDVADEINSALTNAGYTVPIVVGTDPYGFGFAKRANDAGAAAMVLDSVPNESWAMPNEEAPAQTRKGHLDGVLRRFLKVVKDETLAASKASGGSQLGDLTIGSEKDSSGNTNLPMFTRGMSSYPGSRSLTKE